METKYGFTKMNLDEFKIYLSQTKIARTILTIQQHHTYIPSYVHFTGTNHFELQRGMKNTHINQNGWADIGQHFTIFPDGSILTGRSLEKSPACITGNNANSICIENLGYFDKGKDEMTAQQRDTIIKVTASLCEKFSFVPDAYKIVYHHWFDLSTGKRNNGSGNNKSCPGTDFFGGNKIQDCEDHFIPLVKKAMDSNVEMIGIAKYVYVTSSTLNIRTGAGAGFAKVKARDAALFGAILRVYGQKNGWYKISSSSEHWVSARYTKEVKKAMANTDNLNIRSGIGTKFPIIGKLMKGEEVFVYAQKSGWSKIGLEENWVNSSFLYFG